MARLMKPNEVLWMAATPSNWNIRRVKDDYRVVGGGTPSEQDINADFVTRWATPADFSDAERVLAQTARGITKKGHQEIGRTLIGTNGILLSCRAPAGKVALPSQPLSFNQGCKGLSPRHGAIERVWAFYALVDQRMQIEELARGATFAEISGEALKGVMLPSPPKEEQRRIAAWLDIQTGRIDKRLVLLGKKRELLQELRQGLIDEAMLSGFAGSELVQTGQAALPSMPAHWSLSKFKRMVFFREGPGIMAADFTESGVPLLRIGNIKPGLILMARCNYLSPEKVERQWRQFKVRLGDIVISASASTGIVSEVGIDAVGAIPYTGLITLRPKSGISKEYLKFFVISSPFLSQIEEYLKGSTIHHFGPTHLRQMLISVPPVVEQNTIVRVLEKRITRIDAQVTLIDQLEQLIKQQRKAIIHDAVTGKIDLSAYVPPQPQEAIAA